MSEQINGLAGTREGDAEDARLVKRFQGGDMDAFGTLYERWFERVFAYLRALIRNRDDAEDVAQQVFLKLLETPPDYEQRGKPFRAWLFIVVRNQALSHLKQANRLVATDPAEIARRREREGHAEDAERALTWITDSDLFVFVGRLPLPQRQVLLLRFLLDMTDVQIAAVLDRKREDVRALQFRAMTFLRARLEAIGRAPEVKDDDTEREQSGMVRCDNQALVLRERRFCLM